MSAKPTFELPSRAVAEAVRDLRNAAAHGLDIRAYAISAQTLLAELIQHGWTIKPPHDNER